MKTIYTALFTASLLIVGCKGNDSTPSPSPTPTPTSTKTYGFFRALQPKLSSVAQPMKVSASAAANNPSVTMATPRSGHKAIAIGGGKFMLIGGETGNNPISSTWTGPSVIDIFDSVTETFTKSPVVTTVRRSWDGANLSFCLVPLPDGKIWMFGGNEDPLCNTVEIYDPATDSITTDFKDVLNINNADAGYYMGHNKILLVGTRNASQLNWESNGVHGYALIDVETKQMTQFQASFTNPASVQLSDGSVVVAGGQSYNPTTNSWTYPSNISQLSLVVDVPATDTVPATYKLDIQQKGSLAVPRTSFSMCILSDSKIGVYGGGNSTGILSSVEVIDPTTWTSTVKVPLLAPRSHTHATLLQSGYVLNAGGADKDNSLVSDEFVHNHLLNISGTTGNLNMGRMLYSVIPLNNGRLLISGGFTGPSGMTNTAEIYDPASKVLISYDTSTTIPVSTTTTPSVIHFTSTSTVTWSVAPVKTGTEVGSITTTGVYTAPTIPTTVVVTANDGTNTASVTITVVE